MRVRRPAFSVHLPVFRRTIQNRWHSASHGIWNALMFADWPQRRSHAATRICRRCVRFVRTSATPAERNVRSTRWTTANTVLSPASAAPTLVAAWLNSSPTHTKGKTNETRNMQIDQSIMSCSRHCALSCVSFSTGANRSSSSSFCRHAPGTHAERHGWVG